MRIKRRQNKKRNTDTHNKKHDNNKSNQKTTKNRETNKKTTWNYLESENKQGTRRKRTTPKGEYEEEEQ